VSEEVLHFRGEDGEGEEEGEEEEEEESVGMFSLFSSSVLFVFVAKSGETKTRVGRASKTDKLLVKGLFVPCS